MPAPGAVDDADPDIELQNSLPDVRSVRIFVALCREHRVRPYRYPRQRRTTLIVRTRQISFERTVATEFRTLYRESTAYFDETVNHLIFRRNEIQWRRRNARAAPASEISRRAKPSA